MSVDDGNDGRDEDEDKDEDEANLPDMENLLSTSAAPKPRERTVLFP